MKNPWRKLIYLTCLLLVGITWNILTHIYEKGGLEEYEVFFLPSHVPCIQAIINEKPVWLKLDLGSADLLSLKREYINLLQLEKVGTSYSKDMFGNQYDKEEFLLPKVRIGAKKLYNIYVPEEPDIFHINTTISGNATPDPFEQRAKGTFGSLLLEKTSLFFDFPTARIYSWKSKQQFKRLAGDLDQWFAIPFEKVYGELIQIQVESSLGSLHLVVDTGCTWTMLRKDLIKNSKMLTKEGTLYYMASNHFVIGGVDFFKKKLRFIDMKLKGVDGVLGMDFLRKHPFAIDYQNQIIYFKKPNIPTRAQKLEFGKGNTAILQN